MSTRWDGGEGAGERTPEASLVLVPLGICSLETVGQRGDQELRAEVGSAGGDSEAQPGWAAAPSATQSPADFPRGALDTVTAFTCLLGCGRLFGYRS